MSENITKLLVDGSLDYSQIVPMSKSELFKSNYGNFAQPRFARISRRQLQVTRVFSAMLNLVNILFNHWIVFSLYLHHILPLPDTFAFYYYSLWGSMIAIASNVLAFKACRNASWTRLAYFATEFSFGINIFNELVMILNLLPAPSADSIRHPDAYFLAAVHAVPIFTTLLEIITTDIIVQKSHWWMQALALCPCYMILNLFGALTIDKFQKMH